MKNNEDILQPMPSNEMIEQAIRKILFAIGETEREGLKDTPSRVAKAYLEMFSGINQDPTEPLKVQFEEDVYNDFILIKDIEFSSFCEHHLLPFFGKVHIAYTPSNGKVVGLSKFARCVDIVSKRPQVQERMTNQISEAILKTLQPEGVLVVVEAEHMCMSLRGIKKRGAVTVTQDCYGYEESTKRDILSQIKL